MAARLDVPAAVRGASRGFTVLVLGGLLTPLVAATLPPWVAQPWIVMVAVLAFGLAASRPGDARLGWLQGMVAATASLALLTPLWLVGGGASHVQMLLSLLLAVVVGAMSGAVAGHRRDTATAR